MTGGVILVAVAYVSRSTLGGDIGALEDLRHQSVEDNTASEITGVLYYDTQIFFQYLEGPEGVLEPLLERIGRDSRHSQLRILVWSRIETRCLDAWSMKFVSGIANPRLAHEFNFERLSLGDQDTVRARVRNLAQA